MSILKILFEDSNDLVDGLFLLEIPKDKQDAEILKGMRKIAQEINSTLKQLYDNNNLQKTRKDNVR